MEGDGQVSTAQFHGRTLIPRGISSFSKSGATVCLLFHGIGRVTRTLFPWRILLREISRGNCSVEKIIHRRFDSLKDFAINLNRSMTANNRHLSYVEFYSRCRASSEIKYWIKRGGIEINISLAFVREIVRCSMKSIQKKEQKNEIPIHRFEKTRHSSHGYITQFP